MKKDIFATNLFNLHNKLIHSGRKDLPGFFFRVRYHNNIRYTDRSDFKVDSGRQAKEGLGSVVGENKTKKYKINSFIVQNMREFMVFWNVWVVYPERQNEA